MRETRFGRSQSLYQFETEPREILQDPRRKALLSLGVIGAIHEIEFMKMIRNKYNPNLRYYQLGELVLNCPKVNYKLNYKPGLLICPRTKLNV